MTRRQLRYRSTCAEHLRLMLAYKNARGGERTRAWKALRDFVTADLGKAMRIARSALRAAPVSNQLDLPIGQGAAG